MNNFDRIAPIYDSLVKIFFGSTLQYATNYYLSRIPPASKILIVGGGTGQLLEVLNESASGSQVSFLDSAPRMIKRAKTRDFRNLSVEFSSESIVAFEESGYDIIITPFFLDLFINQELIILGDQLRNSLKKGGYWFFSDFVATGSAYQSYLVKLMYWGFGIGCNVSARRLPDYDNFFKTNSMNLISRAVISNGLLESRVYRHI